MLDELYSFLIKVDSTGGCKVKGERKSRKCRVKMLDKEGRKEDSKYRKNMEGE